MREFSFAFDGGGCYGTGRRCRTVLFGEGYFTMLGRCACLVVALALAQVPRSGPDPTTKPAGEKLVLRQWSSPGTYQLTVTSRSEQVTLVNKRRQPARRTLRTMVLALTVLKPGVAGVRRISISYERLKHSIDQDGRVTAFDSDGPTEKQDPGLAAALSPLLKARVTVLLAPDGQVQSVGGLDELWDEMARKDPASAPMLRQMKQQMGNNMIRSLMEKDREMLPPGRVGAGDVWEVGSIQSMPFVGAVEGTQLCRLKAIEQTAAGKVAVIEYEGRVKRTKKSVARFQARSITVHKVDLFRTGEIRLNTDAGMVTSKTFRQGGEIEMSGKAADGSTTEITVRPRLNISTALRRVGPGPGPKPGR